MLVNLMQAEDMILHLKEVFLKMLEEATWLDEATRANARQKVTFLKLSSSDWNRGFSRLIFRKNYVALVIQTSIIN